MADDDGDLYLELEDDVLDAVGAGTVAAAVAVEGPRVLLRLGYQLDRFVADPRLPELNISALEAVTLASALAQAGAIAARDSGGEPPEGWS
jgi:hypothetical protein